MAGEASVMTATFLSLLMFVSFILLGYGYSGANGPEVAFPFGCSGSAKLTFSYIALRRPCEREHRDRTLAWWSSGLPANSMRIGGRFGGRCDSPAQNSSH